jgi:hypothetical protein
MILTATNQLPGTTQSPFPPNIFRLASLWDASGKTGWPGTT